MFGSLKVSRPNSWKLVMLPVPRTLLSEITDSADCAGLSVARSVNSTVMSLRLLLP